MKIKINNIDFNEWNKINKINKNNKNINKNIKYNLKNDKNKQNIFKLILSSGALVTGDFSGLESIIQLLQQFSYYVGLGYGLWGLVEYTCDNPAGGTKVKRAIVGYVGIYVLPVIFKAIRNALS